MNKETIRAFMIRLVTQAIIIARNECHELVITAKDAYNGIDKDLATNGDLEAQKMYVDEITTHLPTFGILGEENGLRIPCTDPDQRIFFTIDPVDGTKAYERKQAHGVGTMIALVLNGAVVAAFVGDVNSGDIYGFCDYGEEKDAVGTAVRIRFGRTTLLQHNPEPLSTQYGLFRDPPCTFPDFLQPLSLMGHQGGLFKKYEVSGGSIGTHMARLWIGEVGGVLISTGFKTPWDEAPIIGITRRLGYRFFQIDPLTDEFLLPYTPKFFGDVREEHYYDLIIHRDHAPELMAWINKERK